MPLTTKGPIQFSDTSPTFAVSNFIGSTPTYRSLYVGYGQADAVVQVTVKNLTTGDNVCSKTYKCTEEGLPLGFTFANAQNHGGVEGVTSVTVSGHVIDLITLDPAGAAVGNEENLSAYLITFFVAGSTGQIWSMSNQRLENPGQNNEYDVINMQIAVSGHGRATASYTWNPNNA